MADNFEQFITDAKRVKLTHEEKTLLRRLLSASLHANPLPKFISNWHSFRFPAVVSLAIILFLVGVPLLAEKSLPGTPLYTVKLNVTEPIERTFVVSDEDKVQFDIGIAERRQAEAESLAAQNGF
ncbi:MAG TPA: hypothetical protein VEK36_02020 [Candidatus Paceibacterota bacterium]|nr:hypothetical protein [Candidatus Paceibacterota bacterium]